MHIIHRKRIVPVLLLHKGGLVKSKKFKSYTYVGDPINAVRIFNDKEVDELVLLDIEASKKGKCPDFDAITDIASEAFMPVAYGGGITTLAQCEQLFYNGVEKVILNSVLQLERGQHLISAIAKQYGSQSVIASIDVKSRWGKQQIFSHSTKKGVKTPVLEFVKRCETSGAGEILLNNVDRDGKYTGYDLKLLELVSEAVEIPVIICGGASTKEDFKLAEQAGASAMAAGSMFVFQRPHNAVLISYDI